MSAAITAAVIGAGAGLYGASEGRDASNDAMDEASDLEQQRLAENTALYAPYRQIGLKALPQYYAMTGLQPGQTSAEGRMLIDKYKGLGGVELQQLVASGEMTQADLNNLTNAREANSLWRQTAELAPPEMTAREQELLTQYEGTDREGLRRLLDAPQLGQNKLDRIQRLREKDYTLLGANQQALLDQYTTMSDADLEKLVRSKRLSPEDYNNIIVARQKAKFTEANGGKTGYQHQLSPEGTYRLQEGTEDLANAMNSRGLQGGGFDVTKRTSLRNEIKADDWREQYRRILGAMEIGRGATNSQAGENTSSSNTLENLALMQGGSDAGYYAGLGGAIGEFANAGLKAYNAGSTPSSSTPAPNYYPNNNINGGSASTGGSNQWEVDV